jgi:hypothetical protein
MPDDQRFARTVSTIFQIAADRFSYPPNILERKFVGNDCSPAGRSEADRHRNPWNEKLLINS